jgi:hypothetical protein
MSEQLCEFEKQCQHLGLATEAEMRNSPELKTWASKRRNSLFIPEHLLDYWGIAVSLQW